MGWIHVCSKVRIIKLGVSETRVHADLSVTFSQRKSKSLPRFPSSVRSFAYGEDMHSPINPSLPRPPSTSRLMNQELVPLLSGTRRR